MRKLNAVNRRAAVLMLLALTAMSTVTAHSAYASGFEQIVGSWKLVDDTNGDIFFGTYNGGPFKGTVNFTTPFSNTSLTHGVWKRTGPRTFADTDSAFIFGEEGKAVMIITFRAEVEVTGDTGRFTFAFELTDLAGAYIDSGASSATGTRIKVRPLS